jgi:hypothetical protein
MTKEEAIGLYKSKCWETMSDRERVEFQLFEERLCMPFAVFQMSVEKVLGRPVFTHEFGTAMVEGLRKEFLDHLVYSAYLKEEGK